MISSRLARRLREERAHQRAKVSSAAPRACGLAPLMLADRERESHLALALIAIVFVAGHGSTSLPHRTGERGNYQPTFPLVRIHCPRRWARRTWPASFAPVGGSEDTEPTPCGRGAHGIPCAPQRSYPSRSRITGRTRRSCRRTLPGAPRSRTRAPPRLPGRRIACPPP